MKKCPSCFKQKPFDEYWKGQSSCISCSKIKQKTCWQSRTPKKRLVQHLKYKYKISYDEFLDLLEKQKRRCAICECELPDLLSYENRRRCYAIDHNHETCTVRGILCLLCNSLLGMAKDCPEILSKAKNYLIKKGSYASKISRKKK